MRLNDSTDIALRIMIYSASVGDRLFTIDDIVATYRVPRSTVMKVVSALTRGAFLRAQRGRSGGLRLARKADEISVAAVIRYVETDFALVECMRSSNACTITCQCRLIQPLQEALAAFLAALEAYSIADIALKPAEFGLAPKNGADGEMHTG